jgi:hypothetical protein
MYAFTAMNIGPERSLQVRLSNTAAVLLGALFLPLLLPLGSLREGRRPGHYTQRLVLLGIFFLPNIIVRFLGVKSWMANPVNSGINSFSNGVIITLVFGLFFSMAGKLRNFWAALSSSLSLFVFYLSFEIMQRYRPSFLPSVLFYGSGIVITIAGAFLLLYLVSLPKEEALASGKTARPPKQLPAGNAPRRAFLFPLLAALVIFWTNSFTQRLFLPTVQLSVGLNLPTVIMIATLPLAGILADRDWARFIKVFIPFSFGVFLLSPSLLLFTRLETVFYVLYTINAITILLIVAMFPFIILDLYWKSGRGYLAGLLLLPSE